MRLLIIEDGKQLAESIVEYLQREGYQCEAASNLEDALEKVALHDYNCILLDITLPDGNGLTVLEQLKRDGKMDGVIIISAKDSLDDRINGLKLGADDYLAKPFHLSELGARIEALIRRKNFQGSNKVVFHELTIDVHAQIATVNGNHLALTRKEYDLLLFLISNKGRIISKNAIAEHLSGDMADMLDNHGFVYAHVKNLKKKLSESGCRDYVKTIYGFGYQWEA
ncbi:MAG: response regulator transcription factor [Cyclobacteriaceae bacterium]